MKRTINTLLVLILIALFGIIMFMCRDYTVYNIVYIFTFLFITCYAIFMPSTILSKIVQIFVYALVMVSQILLNTLIIRTMSGQFTNYNICRLFGVLVVFIPFIIRLKFFNYSTNKYIFPTQEECSAISYSQLLCDKDYIADKIEKFKQAGHVFSRVELTWIMYNLPRHSSFSYVNNGTLTDAYFQNASKELENGYIYIVITKSKAVQSDIIGLFTNQEYNHVSLSFDKELNTIISYNGGDRVNPPGLNAELLETLTERNGSAVIIYRLPATAEQKNIMLEKIREINNEGSAYNLLGLVFKTSQKPNIMFCSQFVYTLLELAGLNYFEKKAAQVTPSDFVELDYNRKLEFVRRLAFDNINLENNLIND